MEGRDQGEARPRGARPLPSAAGPREIGRGTAPRRLPERRNRRPVHAVGGDLHHLQEVREDPEGPSPRLHPRLRGHGAGDGEPCPDRQPPLRRAAHPRARFTAPAGDRAGVRPRLVSGPRPHLDPVVRGPRVEVGLRRHRRLLRRPRAPHLRGRDRPLLRSADELAGLVPRPLPAGVELRRPLAREARAGGVRVRYRARLLRPSPGPGDRGRVRGHARVLSRGRQVPSGRPP